MPIVRFDGSKLPSMRTKFVLSAEDAAAALAVIAEGGFAGDGVTYTTIADARKQAGRVKRQLEAVLAQGGNLTTILRSKVWQSAEAAYHFAVGARTTAAEEAPEAKANK